jgi:hypothetical protein
MAAVATLVAAPVGGPEVTSSGVVLEPGSAWSWLVTLCADQYKYDLTGSECRSTPQTNALTSQRSKTTYFFDAHPREMTERSI